MNAQDSKNLSFAAPVVLLLFVLRMPQGIAQTATTVAAAIATMAFIQLGARFIWTPVFKKAGLRWATLLLVCAIGAGLLATFVASAMKPGDRGAFARDLTVRCALAGLLCSWVLAAIRGAQGKGANQALHSTAAAGRGLS